MNDHHDRSGKFARKPVPDDFRETAPTMYIHQLKAHYRVGFETVRRWLSEAGVSPLSGEGKVNNPYGIGGRSTAPRSQIKVSVAETRIKSIYDEAADILRRERWVVYRCTEKGAAMHKGFHWRVGNLVVTPDELLQRAARYRERVA